MRCSGSAAGASAVMTAISALSGVSTLPAPPHAPNAAREDAVAKEIAAKVAQAQTTDCKDTAAKATREADNLRAELASLKAKDGAGGGAAAATGQAAVSGSASGTADNVGAVGAATANGDTSYADDTSPRYRPIEARASASVQAALYALTAVE